MYGSDIRVYMNVYIYICFFVSVAISGQALLYTLVILPCAAAMCEKSTKGANLKTIGSESPHDVGPIPEIVCHLEAKRNDPFQFGIYNTLAKKVAIRGPTLVKLEVKLQRLLKVAPSTRILPKQLKDILEGALKSCFNLKA